MSFYLGAYWGPRRESAERCAYRLARCLDAIAPYSPLIARWYNAREGVTGDAPPPEDWMHVPSRAETLAERLRQGINRGDGAEEPIADLGFSTHLWNLKQGGEGGASVSTSCGSWSEYAPPNNFLLDLPRPLEAAPELCQPDAAKALIQAVVTSWDPSWATWTSNRLAELQDPDLSGGKILGWATYFSTLPHLAEELPTGAKLERFGGGGLVTIGKDPADVPEELLLAVRDVLGEGALS